MPAHTDESKDYATKNSFRLFFKHGECIDFYADTKEECDRWIEALDRIRVEKPDAIQWMGEEQPVVDGPKRVPLDGINWNESYHTTNDDDPPPPVPPKQKPRNLTKPMHSSRRSGDWIVGQLENESNEEEVERLKEKILQEEQEQKMKHQYQTVIEDGYTAIQTKTRPAVGVFGTRKSLRFA
jgi:hypothetical protein